ncbi:hypothetical protein V6N11_057695 [Hibiscus sabdariffa]|uniref:Uncharacterized protein n=1 Tax=Hibiscus sabdariffa TaxID=183260 RepID=A0ABR2NII5_9ROSI
MLCFVGLSSNASPNNLGLYASIKLLAVQVLTLIADFPGKKECVDGKSINQNPSLQNLILRYFPSANNVDMISSIPFAMVGEIADASPAGDIFVNGMAQSESHLPTYLVDEKKKPALRELVSRNRILPNTTPDLFGALVGCGYWRPGISEQNRCFKFYKSQTFWFKQSQRKLSMKDSVKERSSPLVYGPVGA